MRGRPAHDAARAYSLLRTILGTAVDRNLIATANPAKVRGGGSAERAKKVRPATLAELETLTAAMPDKHRLLVLLASWCALRFGELAELRRNDIDLKSAVVRLPQSPPSGTHPLVHARFRINWRLGIGPVR